MLTRYEEIVKLDRDTFDRFPAWASLAYQEGFLDVPSLTICGNSVGGNEATLARSLAEKKKFCDGGVT